MCAIFYFIPLILVYQLEAPAKIFPQLFFCPFVGNYGKYVNNFGNVGLERDLLVLLDSCMSSLLLRNSMNNRFGKTIRTDHGFLGGI